MHYKSNFPQAATNSRQPSVVRCELVNMKLLIGLVFGFLGLFAVSAEDSASSQLRLETVKHLKSRLDELETASNLADRIVSAAIEAVECSTTEDISLDLVTVISTTDLYTNFSKGPSKWRDLVDKLLDDAEDLSEGPKQFKECRKLRKGPTNLLSLIDSASSHPGFDDTKGRVMISANIVQRGMPAFLADAKNDEANRISCFLSTLQNRRLAFVHEDTPPGIMKRLNINRMSSVKYASNIRNLLKEIILEFLKVDTKPIELSKAIDFEARLAYILASIVVLCDDDYVKNNIGSILEGKPSGPASPLAEMLGAQYDRCFRSAPKSTLFDDLLKLREGNVSEKVPSTNLLFLAGYGDYLAVNSNILDCLLNVEQQFEKEYSVDLTQEEWLSKLSKFNMVSYIEVDKEVDTRMNQTVQTLTTFFSNDQ